MTITKQNSVRTFLIVTLFFMAVCLQAQDWKSDRRVNVMFGLSQILVSGFNIEGNYIHDRLIFDYSHGVSLDFSGNSVNADLKKQGVAVHMPYTTGFGVGYRFAEWVNVRIEPKWHRFEFYYNGEAQNKNNEITSYNTFSLGVGLYGSIRPFRNKNSFLKGLMISPSIRYWPTLSSTLQGDSYSYYNKNTMANEEIKTLDPGIGFTPWVFNISLGYSFNLKKKNL
jgi:hypothetical protein